jgi:5-methylcytosine-specific restriction endonuclease McrA
MTRGRISAALRRAVIDRASGHCEYCRFPQEAALLAFEVERMVAEKHGGAMAVENLALACPFCNRFKGSDLGSLDPDTGELTPFYNPRTQVWRDHFGLDGARIVH